MCKTGSSSEANSDGNLREIKWYCVTCDQILCHADYQHHIQQTRTRRHKCMEIDGTTGNDVCHGMTYCGQHSERQLELYCDQCEMAMCLDCFVLDHNQHRCSKLDTVVEEKKRLIRTDIEYVVDRISQFQNTVVEMERNVNLVEESFKEIEASIHGKYEEMRRVLDDHKDRLLIELKKVVSTSTKAFSSNKIQMENCISTLQSLQASMEEVENKRFPIEVLHASKELHESVERELRIHSNSALGELSLFPVVLFIPTCWATDSSVNTRNVIGEIISCTRDEIDDNDDSVKSRSNKRDSTHKRCRFSIQKKMFEC